MTNEAVMEKYYSMAGKFTEREIAESMKLTVAQLRKIKSQFLRKRYSEQKEQVRIMLKEKLPIYKMAEELKVSEPTIRMYVKDLKTEGVVVG